MMVAQGSCKNLQEQDTLMRAFRGCNRHPSLLSKGNLFKQEGTGAPALQARKMFVVPCR